MAKAVFKAGYDNKFIYDNIIVEQNGSSKYRVSVSYGSSDDGIIVCEVPNVYILLQFLEALTNKRPLFTYGVEEPKDKEETVTNIPFVLREEVDFV